jgi:hypothetical protein
MKLLSLDAENYIYYWPQGIVLQVFHYFHCMLHIFIKLQQNVKPIIIEALYGATLDFLFFVCYPLNVI